MRAPNCQDVQIYNVAVIYADFSTEDLLPRDRFAAWYELMRQDLIPSMRLLRLLLRRRRH